MGTSNAGGTPPPIVGPPLGSEDGIPVKQVGEINVIATPATQVTAAPAEGTPAGFVYVAGTADVKDETARTHLAAIRSQTDELEANTDQVETKLDTGNASLAAIEADADATRIAAQDAASRLGTRRTADAPDGTAGQVVRLEQDDCAHSHTTPGTTAFYLQARNAPGRLRSIHVMNTTSGQSFFILVCDVANYSPPPAAQPSISTLHFTTHVHSSSAGDPGKTALEFGDDEMMHFANGILIVAVDDPTVFVPAENADLIIEAFTKAVPS